jgi:hypothetical protein
MPASESLGIVAVLSVCLLAAVLALVGVTVFVVWAMLRKVGERNEAVAVDLAQNMTDAWEKGLKTGSNLAHESIEVAGLEVRRQRSNQHWSPAADDRDQGDRRDREVIGEFGEEPASAPMQPEMVIH